LSFRNRLLILLIGLVVGAETVTLFTALARTAATERQRADAQLEGGAHVAQRVLEYREKQLANAVTVLTADYGLREAVASGDRPTVASALSNHATRIGANLTLALDLDGKLIASGGRSSTDPGLIAALAAGVGKGTGDARFITAPTGVYQVFISPVLAPDEIAYIALGFSVDAGLAQELRDLVGVDVAFLTGPDGARHATAGTVASMLGAGTLPQSLRASPSVIRLDGVEYLATAAHLASAGSALDIALLKPMDEVMAPFRRLAMNLGVIIGITLAAAVVAGVYLGRSAARPVQDLAEGAARIAAGDYSRGITASGGQELEHLADAFNSMQSGIADRESRLMHMARHDTATGLPNRVFAEEWLSARLQKLNGAERAGLVLLAVNNLQEISASLGFDMAEQLVWHIGRCLEPWSDDDGLVARVDSAHFAVAVCPLRDADVGMLARRVREHSQTPLDTAGITLQAAVVLGAATASRHGNATELLRCAEAAVETAVQTRQPFACFERASDDAQRRRMQLGADLPLALQTGQLHLHYQPKLRMSDRCITGVECLVRWRHPEFGAVSPAEFVPIAERTGASAALTHWVLRTALAQLSTWHRQGIRIDMAVNLSAADIVDPGMLEFILGALRDTQLAAGSLTLEITESVLLHEPEAARRNMELLRVAGVRFSIDDFGTGYSSLSQLRELAADELKIDQSFVRALTQGNEHAAVIRAIIELGHGLGLRTVAEGVEEESQWRMLAAMGCDSSQGYLTGRPQPAEELAPLLQALRPTQTEAAETSSLRVLELRRLGDA
ncbi:MAG TPA: EAL domain-containing protein, partial [Steroidobacteraceae bacterium]|nr:EAL domain-containing protein [Steroidobacteraceae bacterium]